MTHSFPSSFIDQADRSHPFVYYSDTDTNYSGDAERIWPGARLRAAETGR